MRIPAGIDLYKFLFQHLIRQRRSAYLSVSVDFLSAEPISFLLLRFIQDQIFTLHCINVKILRVLGSTYRIPYEFKKTLGFRQKRNGKLFAGPKANREFFLPFSELFFRVFQKAGHNELFFGPGHGHIKDPEFLSKAFPANLVRDRFLAHRAVF